MISGIHSSDVMHVVLMRMVCAACMAGICQGASGQAAMPAPTDDMTVITNALAYKTQQELAERYSQVGWAGVVCLPTGPATAGAT